MKKCITIICALALVLAFTGCGSSGVSQEEYDALKAELDALKSEQEPTEEPEPAFAWCEEDFSFYDDNMDEEVFPTVDDYRINLNDYEDLQTFRGLEIGDRGSKIADLYDLTDFSWSIADFYYINPNTDEAEEYEAKLEAEGKTTAEILEMLDVIAERGLDVGISCTIYESDGVLSTKSSFVYPKAVQERIDWATENGMEVNIKDYEFIKYYITFEIEGEVIADVIISEN